MRHVCVWQRYASYLMMEVVVTSRCQKEMVFLKFEAEVNLFSTSPGIFLLCCAQILEEQLILNCSLTISRRPYRTMR